MTAASRTVRPARCPACGGRRFRPFRRGTLEAERLNRDQIKITDSEYGRVWDLSLCLDCGHLFADPAPYPAFLASLYGQVEDPDYEAEAEGRARNFRTVLKRLERRLPARGRLFDVGAATGLLMNLARRRGWAVDGLDASRWASETAARKYGLRVRTGGFEDADLPEGEFQAVTMIDFIEHTPEPQAAAERAARLLAPGGVLALVTPDIHSPAARLAARRWWHLRPGHVAYFSRRSLDALLLGAGLRVVARRRYAWNFSLHYLVSRFPGLVHFAASRRSSFLKRIPIKLALGDSFEIYAVKDRLP